MPITCEQCKGLGHTKQKCRKTNPKAKTKVGAKPTQQAPKKQQQWRPIQKHVASVKDKQPAVLFTPEVFPALVRIWILWKPDLFCVDVLAYGAQFIHMKVKSRVDGKQFLLTMIYAHNDLYERIELWNFLKDVALHCNEPWLWAGDFNIVLTHVERLGGNTTDAEMEHFQECVSLCCVEDLQATGALFTWSNKQEPIHRVYTRLDRVMGNHEWMMEYGDYMAHFHPEGNNLINNPGHIDLMQQEMEVAQELRALLTARDSFLMQKAKIQCSLEGNLNTAYFHNSIKKRVMQNKIHNAFLDFYIDLLGSHRTTDPLNTQVVKRGKCCTPSYWEVLNRPVTAEEVQKCLFSIPKDKSPGLDDYTSQFCKDAWEIVGDEVCAVVLNFFDSGKMLNQINATLITLIPKVDRPTSVKHFRPIACCNVIYKIIFKIMCTRLAAILPEIISRNQGAFIQDRSILENILIFQDLVKMYNRGNCSPRCMFKMDLQKAYDSIE
ncbi:uncharacterized protein LOC141620604 [Silene latifolia]|uniref:uncharacterized protein LOC141620604 n=1 Tax=Silene latifolia TaxID=37657 RepID=UPI003D784198